MSQKRFENNDDDTSDVMTICIPEGIDKNDFQDDSDDDSTPIRKMDSPKEPMFMFSSKDFNLDGKSTFTPRHPDIPEESTIPEAPPVETKEEITEIDSTPPPPTVIPIEKVSYNRTFKFNRRDRSERLEKPSVEFSGFSKKSPSSTFSDKPTPLNVGWSKNDPKDDDSLKFVGKTPDFKSKFGSSGIRRSVFGSRGNHPYILNSQFGLPKKHPDITETPGRFKGELKVKPKVPSTFSGGQFGNPRDFPSERGQFGKPEVTSKTDEPEVKDVPKVTVEPEVTTVFSGGHFGKPNVLEVPSEAEVPSGLKVPSETSEPEIPSGPKVTSKTSEPEVPSGLKVPSETSKPEDDDDISESDLSSSEDDGDDDSRKKRIINRYISKIYENSETDVTSWPIDMKCKYRKYVDELLDMYRSSFMDTTLGSNESYNIIERMLEVRLKAKVHIMNTSPKKSYSWQTVILMGIAGLLSYTFGVSSASDDFSFRPYT